jgi:2-keto-4-pentenoate hydratase/2-oxohepta-3-ene-1,7-dioic acid hydratase in catechol pathway
MRLISFATPTGPSYGIATDDGIIDAPRHLDTGCRTLRELLIAGGIDTLRSLASRGPDYGLDAIGYLPVIHDPAAKFLCVGVNYMPHIREMGRERPAHPVVFVRFANSFVGHGEPMLMPRGSVQYDFEGELAVVIGRRAHRVPRHSALDFVAGYSCLNDGSVRDFQWHGPQWTPGKNFYRSGAFGPWLTTADELPDPGSMTLTTTVNGNVMQHESIAELCFDVPALIEYITSWTVLEPGDVIATGTPGGVGAGRKPPVWMQPGDNVEVDISGIGRLSNHIAGDNES